MAKGRQKKTGAAFDDLAVGFRHGQFAPLYFFYGAEGWFGDELQRLAVEHALEPHERDFNLDVVFGPEANAQAVLAQCAQFPMMAARRLVVVRGFEKLDDNGLFKGYAEAPNPHAVVVLLCNAKPNLSAHPYRALKEHAVWAEFAPLKDRQLPGWVEKRFRARRVQTEAGAAQMLAETAGPDLRALDAEVEKLVTYVGDRARVTRDDVLRAAGHSAEQNPFELQNALAAGDVRRALAIADGLLTRAGNRRGEALKIVGLLTAYVTKLWKLTGCLASGVPEGRWAGQIGVPPFYVREYAQAARRFGPDALRRAFEALLAADTELKGGSHRDERLVLTLALRRMAAPRR
jgi:DNA polymerase-3 subunit delta